DPVMAGDVAHAPGRGRAAARKLRRNVHDRHEVKLHPAEGLGLMKPEQPALVQELLVVADEHAGVLAALGARAQDRDDLAPSAHRFAVADGGEITTPPLRQRAPRLAVLVRAHHLPSERFHAPHGELSGTLPRTARRRHAWDVSSRPTKGRTS